MTAIHMTKALRSIFVLFGLSCVSFACYSQAATQKCSRALIETNTDLFQVLVSSNDINAVEHYLHFHSVDLNGFFSKCITPLDVAVDAKHPEMVDFLIAHGADINRADGQGAMPLHRAAYFNNPSMVTYLVKKGAQIDAPGAFGMTPLNFAAQAGNLEASEALLKAGANVDGNDSSGKRHGQRSPLEDAFANKHKDVAQLLIDHGANVLTDLGMAAQIKGWADIVRQIIDRGTKCEAVDNNSAPIDTAVDPESIRLIIACVTKRTGKAPDLTKALNSAVSSADMDRIQALLSAGANIRSVIPLGGPLNNLSAADFTEYLLDLGADPNARDVSGNTALDLLAYRAWPESIKIAKVLMARGAKANEPEKNPLFGAAQIGHIEMVSLLLDNGADLNMENQLSQTLLFVAIENNHLALANLLLERGADPNQLYGQAISLAAARGQLDLLAKMLKKGGNPNGWPDGERVNRADPSRPLIAAIVNGNLDAARLLLDRGADPNGADRDGSTPLHAATKTGQVDMVTLLVSHKAKTSIRDRNGLRPENFTENPAILGLLKVKSASIDKEHNHRMAYDGALCEKIAKQTVVMLFVD